MVARRCLKYYQTASNVAFHSLGGKKMLGPTILTTVGRTLAHVHVYRTCISWYMYAYAICCLYAVIFDLDSHFTIEAISRLKEFGIEPLAKLEAHKRPLQSVVGMDKVDLPIDNSFSLLKLWVRGRASLRPTWRHFFWTLREIKLNHLADQIEAFLSGVAVEQIATSKLDVNPGSEETEGGHKYEQGEPKQKRIRTKIKRGRECNFSKLELGRIFELY